jgi:very-short-patch-repair endonuclease
MYRPKDSWRFKNQRFCSKSCAIYHNQSLRPANPTSNTSIERAIQGLLVGLDINFETHWRFNGFSADIYLPDYNKAIECDGDYWHSQPLTKQTDARKSKAFYSANIPVLHLTESEIVKELKVCKQKILEFIS